MSEKGEAKKLYIIRILQVLERYSDQEHPLKQSDIIRHVKEDYAMDIERKAITASMKLLKDIFKEEGAFAEIVEVPSKGVYLNRLFDNSELRLLIDSVLASRHINEKQTKTIIDKLCKLTSDNFKPNVEYVYSVRDWVKTLNTQLFLNIDLITEAIGKKKKIKLDYNRYGADRKLIKTHTHIVSPYHLLLHNQHYFLVSHSDKWQNQINLRVDKMTNVEIIDEPAVPIKSLSGFKNGMDYRKLSTAYPYMFTDDPEPIEFITSELMISEVIDWFGKACVITDEGGGKINVKVCASPNAMEYWSLQYLNNVEILRPQSLRDKIKHDIEAASKKYQ